MTRRGFVGACVSVVAAPLVCYRRRQHDVKTFVLWIRGSFVVDEITIHRTKEVFVAMDRACAAMDRTVLVMTCWRAKS